MLIQDLPSLKTAQISKAGLPNTLNNQVINNKNFDAFKNIEIKKPQTGSLKFSGEKNPKELVEFEQMLKDNGKDLLKGTLEDGKLKSKISEKAVERKEFFPKKEIKNPLKKMLPLDDEVKVSSLSPDKIELPARSPSISWGKDVLTPKSISSESLDKVVIADNNNIVLENPIFEGRPSPSPLYPHPKGMPTSLNKDRITLDRVTEDEGRSHIISFLNDSKESGLENPRVQEATNLKNGSYLPPAKPFDTKGPTSLFKSVFFNDSKELSLPQKMNPLKNEMVFFKRASEDDKIHTSKVALNQYEDIFQQRSEGPYQKMAIVPPQNQLQTQYQNPTPVFESHMALALPVLLMEKDDFSFENKDSPFTGLPTVAQNTPSTEIPVFKLQSIENIPTTKLIDEIKGYISQLSVSNRNEVALAFDHQELGKVLVSLEKSEGNKISLSIETNSDKAASFFNEHKGELSSVLKSGGNDLSDFRITQHSSESSLSASSSSSPSFMSISQQAFSAEGFMNRFDDPKQNSSFNDRSNQGFSERQKDQQSFQGHGQGGQGSGERGRRYAQYEKIYQG